ncbi:hypothetical protein L873DRAFT_173052 [Choiromyces venosus 120613-1]|uniref:Ubiquitin-like protease family profile domain-containing protein n=1 Tax=Choiromyces venosus 120613-1 TaxID=1336337 RepID=A0A3N4JYV8_9PEZI|nr:hypothetical protein L873DRAFT_173052 [Choiromyces venosus 120613-1]
MSPASPKTIDLESSSTTLPDDRDDKEEDQDQLVHLSDSEETAAQKLQASAQVSSKDDDPRDIGTVEGSLEQMSLDEDEWPKEDLDEPLDPRQIVVMEDPAVQVVSSKTTKKKAKVERPNKRSVPADTPAIIILDSMGYGSSSRPTTIKNLKDYLAAEALNKRNLEITRADINATYAKAPNQNNYYDCGPYLLHYVERFFEQPKEFVTAFLAREDVKLDKELWRKDEIKGMRSKIFDVIVDLREQFENFELAKAVGKVKRNGLKQDGNGGEATTTGKGKEAEVSVCEKEATAVEIQDADCVMEEGGAIPDGPSNPSNLSSPKSAMSTSRSPTSNFLRKKDEEGSSGQGEVLGIRSKPGVSGVS